MATGLLTLACLLVATGAPPAEVFPMNNRSFDIPINVDPAKRQTIKQFNLYVSTDQGLAWREVAVATPEKTNFPFVATSDGLFWFTLCIVDRDGNRDPADINHAEPGLKIMVDTVKPRLRIVAAERQGDEILVSWETQDEHPDLGTLKLEYRDASANQWYSAPISPTASGRTSIRLTNPGSVALRMQVQDQAGNLVSTTAEVPAAPTTSAYTPAASPAPPVPAYAPTASLTSWDPPRSDPQVAPRRGNADYAVAPLADGRTENARLVATSDPAPIHTAAAASTGGSRGNGSEVPLQIVNGPQVTLDYQLSKVGPSGVGKVELWMTQDDGKTWRRYAEDADLKPPMVVDLPGEGVYGLSLVVQSKAGLGKRAPLPGDAPEMRIEVDATPPAARLYAPEPDPSRPNALLISWTASDKNLTTHPITLQWAEKPGGNWETIAADLPNSGRYSWQLPSQLPFRVYLRLLAQDTAGNSCKAETSEPVLVDLNEPEGRILGIMGSVRKP